MSKNDPFSLQLEEVMVELEAYMLSEAFREDLKKFTGEFAEFLRGKNEAYGNAALDPLAVFSMGANPTTLIRARLDDKLSRMARGRKVGEDSEWDLLGYLTLLFILRKQGLPRDTRDQEQRGARSHGFFLRPR